ncbi:MAG: hypothetical protein V3573_11815 [Desulfovibrionaceae bacterium]
MILTEKHVQILKHIQAYANVKRYHGMLPEREALAYDELVLDSLKENGLVEEGMIMTSCGSNPKGYRLSDGARAELEAFGIDFTDRGWEKVRNDDNVSMDQLDKEHIEMLRDIYHLSRVSRNHGVAPGAVLDDYEKPLLRMLYDMGYVFHIKLKGKNVKHGDGYVLSDKATRLLRQIGLEG